MPVTGKMGEFSLFHCFSAQLYILTVSFVLTLGFIVRDLDQEINPIEGIFPL